MSSAQQYVADYSTGENVCLFAHGLAVRLFRRHVIHRSAPRETLFDGCLLSEFIESLSQTEIHELYDIGFGPRQQNLWVNSGSGSRPSV